MAICDEECVDNVIDVDVAMCGVIVDHTAICLVYVVNVLRLELCMVNVVAGVDVDVVADVDGNGIVVVMWWLCLLWSIDCVGNVTVVVDDVCVCVCVVQYVPAIIYG